MSRKLEQHLKLVNYADIATKVKNFQKKAGTFKVSGDKNMESKVRNT